MKHAMTVLGLVLSCSLVLPVSAGTLPKDNYNDLLTYRSKVDTRIEVNFLSTQKPNICLDEAKGCHCKATYQVVNIINAPVSVKPNDYIELPYACSGRQSAQPAIPWGRALDNGNIVVEVQHQDLKKNGSKTWQLNNANNRFEPLFPSPGLRSLR